MATVPAFDLDKPSAPLWGEIRLTQGRVHQAVAFVPGTGVLYVSQVISDGRQLPDEPAPVPGEERDAHGDMCINEVQPDGTLSGAMYLRGFGHGGGIGAEPDPGGGAPWLWVETDAPRAPNGSFAYGIRICRIRWQKDLVVDAGTEGLDVYDPLPGATHVTPHPDFHGGRMLVHHWSEGEKRYTLYDLADFKAKNFAAPITTVAQLYPEKTWQGCTLFGDLIYQWEGNAYNSTTNPPPPLGEGNVYVTVQALPNGVAVERVHCDIGLDLNHREPEGLTVRWTGETPELVTGFATREPGPRLMQLFTLDALKQITPPVGDLTLWANVVDAYPLPVIRVDVWVVDPGDVKSWTLTRVADGHTAPIIVGKGVPTGAWQDDSAPLGVPVVYRLDVVLKNGTTRTVTSEAVVITGTAGCWLSDPGTIPARVVRAQVQAWETRTWTDRQSVLAVQRRPDPVVLSDAHLWPSSMMRLITRTDAELAELLAVLTGSRTVLLRTQPAASIPSVWAAVGEISEKRMTNRGDDERRFVEVDLQEIAALPATGAAHSNATLQELHDAFPGTLQDLADAFPTLFALSQWVAPEVSDSGPSTPPADGQEGPA